MSDTTKTPSPLLKVDDLKISFRAGKSSTTVVKDISFYVDKGETVAVVGESGSGKSVTALSLTRLLPDNCDLEGEIHFDGKNILALNGPQIREIRGKKIAYIFQEPSTSLNPVFTIGYQIAEVIQLHRPDVKDVEAEIVRNLDLVGIRDAVNRINDYPHQLSGGMQQRVMIAMALACQPDLLIADEPTTALDVTIQAQIMDLLADLKKDLGMAVLLITHNFGIVSGFADRVIVMFRGDIVEDGPTEQVLKSPQHPYTQALIDCIPRLGHDTERLTTIDYAKLDT